MLVLFLCPIFEIKADNAIIFILNSATPKLRAFLTVLLSIFTVIAKLSSFAYLATITFFDLLYYLIMINMFS
jgi:hypothetical protein